MRVQVIDAPGMANATAEYSIDPEILDCVAAALARCVDEIDIKSSFIANGGDSIKAIILRSALVERGYDVTREGILTKPCLSSLLCDIKRSSPALNCISITYSSPGIQGPKDGRSDLTSPSSDLPETRLPPIVPPSPKDSLTRNGVRVLPTGEFTEKEPSLLPHLSERVTESHTAMARTQAVPASHEAADLLTEMQLSLIHGTFTHSSANMITYVEYHMSEKIPALVSAWEKVLEFESAFQGSWFKDLVSTRRRDASREGVSTQQTLSNGLPEAQKKAASTGFSLEVTACDPGRDDRPMSKITWKVHHAFIDACSLQGFLRKVRGLASGLEVKPSPSFWNWASELRHYQRTHKVDGDAFWRKTLSQHPEAKGEFLFPVPTTISTESNQKEEGLMIETLNFDILDFADQLASVARLANVTPTVFFYVAWALVVATFSDADDAVFGAVLNGRNLAIPGSLETIGPLINVLPLHVKLARHTSVGEFLTALFRNLVELETYSWTTTANGFTRQYDSALSVEMPEPAELERHPFSPLETHTTQRSQVPISITVKGFRTVKLDFHSDRFNRHDMVSITNCYKLALSLLMNLQTTVGNVMKSLLSCPSHARLMKWGNCISGLTAKPSVTQDLVTLFEGIAEAYPDATAVERGNARLSYRELDIVSNQVAHKLASLMSLGDVVCVHSDRSFNWICAIWGVLKAGCAYCPLDPFLPAKLRDNMICSAGAKAIVTSTDDQLLILRDSPASKQEAVFSVESASRNEPTTFGRRTSPQSWQAAYVCFTSGSTGVPKPVLCSHAGLVAFQSDLNVRLNAKPGVRISQIMSVAFDGSIHEIFSALTYGATLVLPTGADSLEPLGRADSAILTPSVYLVGEPVPQTVANKWSATKTLYNMYGPTEATCGATIKRLLPGQPVTIGVPNPTTRLYILSARRTLSQPGMIGRIHLSGVQVSQGYLGMPQQTEERFLPDTIMCNGERMYDSGDLGYWNEEGEVVYVGRNDRQVKLRGYRLDLNDLEIRIARDIPEVQAVAIARRGGAGDELVAVVQPADVDLVELRIRLSDTLPRYAIPSHLIAVDRIPTTSAGKIDYKAIASADAPKNAVRGPALVTDTERAVASAFLAVLQKTGSEVTVNRQQSLAEMGGHSLEQIKLARYLTKKLGVAVPLKTVISNATIQELGRAIDEIIEAKKPGALGLCPMAPADVTPIEQEWLEKSQIGAGTSCFNVAFLGRMKPDQVDSRRLEDAFNVVLQRHEVLRSLYYPIRPTSRSKHCRKLTGHIPRAQHLEAINIWSELNRPHQLGQEQPIRVLITKKEVLVVMSHVVADYTTMALILREVSLAYHGHHLRPPRAVYPDPALWGATLSEDHCNFWSRYLEEPPQQPRILRNMERRTSYQGSSTIFRFNEDTSRAILQYASSGNISLQQLALAAVTLALALDGESNPSDSHDGLDVILGVPFMNRESAEHAETVGLFLQPLPVRIKHEWKSTDNRKAFLATVRHSTQSALAHGLPWHQVLDLMSITPDYPDHPLFDVMVTFHEPQMLRELCMDIPGVEACFAWSAGAKFKLMCEFMAVSDSSIVLRLEHDNKCLSSQDVGDFLQRVSNWMNLLAGGSVLDSSVALDGLDKLCNGSVLDEDWVLGRPLAELS